MLVCARTPKEGDNSEAEAASHAAATLKTVPAPSVQKLKMMQFETVKSVGFYINSTTIRVMVYRTL